ncbi:bifunctional acetate--CoA ligase family protein/GNAT family N-acetyltransferase [uncultured Desulfosarcina sp.]|uniref:bifunctional acetate--CoA ligase family protein/GNAT family N-acetyltransferase n=1 Tax=uncultured Desulfosarcina sp. TaxID=218289 RepID=UPI0029C633C9|nr:bifunctional acetate--CoA ligase family protein/GNAT family N-acetyltransferase [uncultured Desulfosarcina sp.]
MGIDRLDTIFHPASIAIVGASARPGSVGRAILRNLIDGGFEGPIFPVNEIDASIMGKKAYTALSRIEDPVDLVVVATPLETVPGIVADCSRIKAAGVVIISADGKEAGLSGRPLESKIRDAAALTGLRIVGPNCLGIMYGPARLNASFAGPMPLDGKLAFVSQSGAICTAILDFSLKEHIGFSHFISLGSMLDVDFGDIIDYLSADPAVTSIVMYVESLTRHRNFMSAARSASRVKPIIALKAGRSRAGAIAAASHTGAMAGEDAVYDAAFQRAGIVRVRTFEELFDTAEILSRKCRFKGPGLAIVSNAGGPGVMAADALSDYGMEPVRLSHETLEALDAILPEHWSHGNPVDILGDATPQRYAAAASILTRAKEVQALLVMLAPQALTDAVTVAQTLADQFSQTTLPVLTAWLGGIDVEKGRERFNQAGIATFDTPERAVRAFMNLHRHARGIEMLQQIPPRLSKRIQVDRETAGRLVEIGLSSPDGRLTEIDAKSLIAAYGIPVNPTTAAASADEAVSIAKGYGFPVVMKILSRDIIHKTDAGGVILDLKTGDDVKKAYTDLIATAGAAVPQAKIDGVTIQPMISKPDCELIMGTKRDPDFGPVILFGMGGILADLLNDRAIALPPLNRLLASRLMEGTRIDQLLKGYRNHPPAERERLDEMLIRLSQLITDFPQIAELDINPVVIKNGQPIAVDARVVLTPSSFPAPMHLAVSPYPAQYESRVQLADIGELLIRPIRPDDAQLLVEMFETLSPQSIYYRFFSPMKQLSPTMLARFTQIDYDREIALVAILESGPSEKMLGAARVILQHNMKDAEFAVLVGDPWHGKGIGAHLLATCLNIARDRQFRIIWGTVLAENKGMLALCRKLGFTIKRGGQSGEFELTLDMSRLPPAAPVSN